MSTCSIQSDKYNQYTQTLRMCKNTIMIYSNLFLYYNWRNIRYIFVLYFFKPILIYRRRISKSGQRTTSSFDYLEPTIICSSVPYVKRIRQEFWLQLDSKFENFGISRPIKGTPLLAIKLSIETPSRQVFSYWAIELWMETPLRITFFAFFPGFGRNLY